MANTYSQIYLQLAFAVKYRAAVPDTGPGLSLSYDIVTKTHGGRLKVNGREGEYAEFVIILPINP